MERFFILVTKNGKKKKKLGPKWEWGENVGMKIIFPPKKYRWQKNNIIFLIF